MALGLLVPSGGSAAEGFSFGEENPTIVVRPGERRAHRVAVQRFAEPVPAPLEASAAGAAAADRRMAPRFRVALEEALLFTPAIATLPDAAFLGPLETPGLHGSSRDDCPDWRQGGADALVEGTLLHGGGRVVVEIAVWDVVRCRRLLRESYSPPTATLERFARRIADDIVGAITGTRGASATELAFISTRSGVREVMVMDADGGRVRAATNANSVKAFPAWLPSGDGVLYTAYVTGRQPALYMTARRPGVKAGAIFSSVLPGAPKYRGVLSPDGQLLALVASVEGSADIYLVERSARRVERLTHSTAIEVSPTWSPDGERIAFVSDRSGSPQIYVMNRDGSDKRRLTFQGNYNSSPAWSPDGRWIAYQTLLEGQFDIWLIDPLGEVNFPLIEHPRSDESPTWSPDSRWIAFSSTRRGRADLYLWDLGGQRLKRLTRSAGANTYPAWGPYPR
jgi:TolB protein